VWETSSTLCHFKTSVKTNEGGFSSLALAELGTTMGEEHRAGPSPLVNFRSESSRGANHRLAKN
jgi:hypothetical protein